MTDNIKNDTARLIIENIGNLKRAEITIDDNCIIAGHNNIGKSTITKILYSIIKGVNLADKIYTEFLNNTQSQSLEEKQLEILKFTKKYKLHVSNSSNLQNDLYTKYLFKYLSSALGKNILRFGEIEGRIIFSHKDFLLVGIFLNDGSFHIQNHGKYTWFQDATLISSTEVLNYSNLITTADTYVSESFNSSKLVSIQDKDLIDKLNTESLDMLDENYNIKEGLGFDESGYAFYKENGNEIQMKMLGTGKKLFIMLDKLVKNKSINDNTLVMFDEPEEGMHPEWQLDFIEKLFDMKIPFALTTHSPYIIQSVIYYSQKSKTQTEYYTVKHINEYGYAKCLRELKPLIIVKDLTNPILKVRGF